MEQTPLDGVFFSFNTVLCTGYIVQDNVQAMYQKALQSRGKTLSVWET
jgi:hypothetical protein